MGIYVFEASFLCQDPSSSATRPIRIPATATSAGSIPYIVKHGKAVAHHFSKSCVKSRAEAECNDVGTVDAYWESQHRPHRRGAGTRPLRQRMAIWTCRDHAAEDSSTTSRAGAGRRHLAGVGRLNYRRVPQAVAAVHRRARQLVQPRREHDPAAPQSGAGAGSPAYWMTRRSRSRTVWWWARIPARHQAVPARTETSAWSPNRCSTASPTDARRRKGTRLSHDRSSLGRLGNLSADQDRRRSRRRGGRASRRPRRRGRRDAHAGASGYPAVMARLSRKRRKVERSFGGRISSRKRADQFWPGRAKSSISSCSTRPISSIGPAIPIDGDGEDWPDNPFRASRRWRRSARRDQLQGDQGFRPTWSTPTGRRA